jgi:transformer-2 protein
MKSIAAAPVLLREGDRLLLGAAGPGPRRGTETVRVEGKCSKTHVTLVNMGSHLHRGEGGGTNPGNNLHVSGLSSTIDSRELESIFSKIGKVWGLLSSAAGN